MTRIVLTAAAMAAFAALATAAAASPADLPGDPAARRGALPVEGVITHPTWDHLPSANDLSRLYPERANFLGVSGRAVMTCLVSDKGDVQNCQVVSETPPDMGFGAAALAMAPLFHMIPQAVDGEAAGGARVTIPINFAMAKPTVVVNDAPPGPPPSTQAMAVARRLIAALHRGDVYKDGIKSAEAEDMRKAAAKDPASRSISATTAKLVDEAVDAALPDYLESLAATYARYFTMAQLTELTAFMEGPTGQAWDKAERAHILDDAPGLMRLNQAITDGMRSRACALGACPDAAQPPPGPTAPPTASRPGPG